MGVFYVLLLIPIMIKAVAVREFHADHQKRNRAALGFFFLWLTILLAFRHESVGKDTGNYIYFFKKFSYMNWSAFSRGGLEVGFRYLNKLISLFTKKPQVYLAVVAIMIVAMMWPTYSRLCEDAALTVVLFCTMSTFAMMFSGLRQMIAIGLGCIGYDFVRQKKRIGFLLIVSLAMLFHTSAFMLAFMYPLYHVRITKKSMRNVIPVLVLCFIFNRPIFGVLLQFLGRYTRFESEITSTGAFAMLILFGLFTVFSFVIPDEKKLDEETIGLRNFLLMTFVLQMFAPLHSLAMRMGYYYMIFIPLLLPRIITRRNRQWNQIAKLGRAVMVLFFLVYFFVNASGGGSLDVFPYHFFWEYV